MRALIVTPAPPHSLTGNRVTATRWGMILRQLGHRVTIATDFVGQDADLLIALHARKSASSVRRWAVRRPGLPVIVALTGTDVYRDLAHSAAAVRSLELANRLVVLQPLAVRQLPLTVRRKTRVIFQSSDAVRARKPAAVSHFEVAVVGHLRAVKDPLRAAYAVRELPEASRIRVTHVGQALTKHYESMAVRETRMNRRYRWLAAVSNSQSRRLIARSRALVVSSRMEGGAIVISEAIVNRTPVLASRIDGNVGMLGERYAGFFPYGDTNALRGLLLRLEQDTRFESQLRRQCDRLYEQFSLDRERRCWCELLSEISAGTR